MSNIECAILVLRTSDLTKAGNKSGIKADFNMSPYTWKNINLRTVLGPMYDKYDSFNLCLTTVCSGGVLTANNTYILSTDPNDNLVILTISGLPFLNNVYDTRTQHNTNVSTLGCYQFVSDAANINIPIPSSTTFTASNGGNTFGKYQEMVDLTICYNRVIDNAFIVRDAVTNTGDFPQVQFIFNIFGIQKDENNKNGSRLKIV
jgi:hypothetical protein